VSGQAVGALLTAFICSPISIYLAISVLRNNRPGRPLAWLAILINVGLLGVSVVGGLLRGS
jgi:Ca2+/H+ antiporter